MKHSTYTLHQNAKGDCMAATFYPYIGGLIWISILLLLGAVLRAKVPFLQKGLIPSALIGGLIGFFLMNFGLIGMPTAEGWMTIPVGTFGVLVSHLFAFGFVGIGLLQPEKTDDSKKSNWIRSGALWMALIYCLVYAVQSLAGKGIFELYAMLTGDEVFTGYGYLVGAGFAQGPGQAQAMGNIWQSTYGVQGAGSIGLAFGAMGFLCAIGFGIPFANKGIANQWTSTPITEMPKSLLTGIMGKGNSEECARATTHTANIDSLGFHFAVMGAMYGLGYMFALAWSINMPQGINGLGFGLLYAWTMIFGIICRKLLAKGDKIFLLDPATTRRITGSTVDFMICAVFMGISVSDVMAVITPFVATVFAAGISTFLVILWYARRMPEFGFERGLAIIGCYTGTVATGLLLLRIVDRDFKTPAAVELAIMNVFILPIVQLIYLNQPFVPTEGSMLLPVLIAYAVAMPIALYVLKFVGKKAW